MTIQTPGAFSPKSPKNHRELGRLAVKLGYRLHIDHLRRREHDGYGYALVSRVINDSVPCFTVTITPSLMVNIFKSFAKCNEFEGIDNSCLILGAASALSAFGVDHEAITFAVDLIISEQEGSDHE